ncbi:hypothetical protein C8F04DRAFT_1397784 [Mycena alexandri]|uniref:Transmembrane protein n=1 Tax=Mycena alexandri TaxID=1745969 RepID=A0AAD6WZQ3_9AGAR|nr:hypothetical protein C8F04DRAFT_1397784 [Mycena alexandri]
MSGTLQEIPASLIRPLQTVGYVFTGSTAVLVWDILNNLRNDYTLLSRHKMSPATAAYVVSRIASLVYTLGFTLFATYPLTACNAAFIAFNSFYPITVSSSAFLFFFRVRAIYNNSRVVTVIFGVLWLAVLATSITVPVSGRGGSAGDPPQCFSLARHGAHGGSSGITITIHDTIVYFAISYRLVSNFGHTEQTRGDQLKELFTGANLPAFSKSLFTDGQMYYMITVVTNIITTVLVYVRLSSSLYHGIMVIPNVTLTSMMACRVYRNTILGLTRGGGKELSLPTLANGHQSIQLSGVQFAPRRSGATRSTGDVSHSTGELSGAKNLTLKVNDSRLEVHDDTGAAAVY